MRQPTFVVRSRLIEPLIESRLALVTASGGYGKTTLLRQLADRLSIAVAMVDPGPAVTDPRSLLGRLQAAFRHRGLSDLAATVGGSTDDSVGAVADLIAALRLETEPVLLAIDDAHHLQVPDGAILTELANGLPAPHRLIVLTRRVDGWLVRLAGDPAVIRVDELDLCFTEAEIADLLARARTSPGAPGMTDAPGPAAGAGGVASAAAMVARMTAGWPAAVGLLVEDLGTQVAGTTPSDAIAADPGALLGRLLDERLDGLPAKRRALVGQVALLPTLTPGLVAEATEDAGLLDALIGCGIPIQPAGSGRQRMPDPVRERLAAERLDPRIARRAATWLARADELEDAIGLLVGAGLADEAAGSLAGLSPDRVERIDLRTMRALVRSIPETALRAHPRAWLHLARACDAAADRGMRDAALASVAATISDHPDASLERELDAERARDLARDGAIDAAEALALRVLHAVPPDEPLTRVRALHTLGRVAAWRATPRSLAEAETLLDDVVLLYRELGMPGWSAHAALSLAYHVHHPRGESAAALARLDEALSGLAGRQRLRAVLLTFKAEILIATGRAAEALGPDDEARAIGAALGDRRVLGYVAWNEARAASQAGDAARTLDRLAEVERHPGDWFEHFTGAELLADAAVLADRVGETEASARYLARARARRAETEQAVLIAEAVVAARSGDPAEAEAGFRALETTERLETRDRWWLALMRAWAARRAGDPGARALAEQAFRMAAAIDPALPSVREPMVSAALRDWLGTPDPDPVLGVTLRLLGPTMLRRGTREVPVPPGRPAALLEMLGLADEVPVDEVLERLWPEIDPDIGRARLRNTLNRLRDACGPVVVRHGDALRLAAEVSVDARHVEASARAALDGLRTVEGPSKGEPAGITRAGALEAARAVINRHTGMLLPGRPYDEWAIEGRERLVRLQLALIDRVLAVARSQRDLDDAIRLARSGIALDPDDEGRYVELAQLLLRQGRRGPALATLQAAVRMLADLGLQPGPALAAELAAIGRPPDGRTTSSPA